VEDQLLERLNEFYGDDSWTNRIEPYVVRIPRGKYLVSGSIGSMGVEPFGDHLTRDTFGSVWRTDTVGAEHLVSPVLKEPSLKGYVFPEAKFPQAWKRGTRREVEENSKSFTIVGAGYGLWDHCWHLRGFENAMMDSITEPRFFQEMIERLTQLNLDAIALREGIPSDAIMFGDDLGHQNGVMVGPDRWRKYFKKAYTRIFDAIHKQGKFSIIHCCGSVDGIVGDLIDVGLDVLQSVQPEARGMNPYELKKKFGKDITFWGCLGSQSTIPFGTPESIKAEVRRLKREMSKGGGYILGGAKQLRPDTPLENAVAVIDAFTEG
jgi:uroporphyrinogen decarboxylase